MYSREKKWKSCICMCIYNYRSRLVRVLYLNSKRLFHFFVLLYFFFLFEPDLLGRLRLVNLALFSFSTSRMMLSLLRWSSATCTLYDVASYRIFNPSLKYLLLCETLKTNQIWIAKLCEFPAAWDATAHTYTTSVRFMISRYQNHIVIVILTITRT